MSKQENKRIFLTGGHAATTGLSTIEEFQKRDPGVELFWVGVKFAMEGKKIPSLESKVFPERGVTFLGIVAGRLQRKLSLWTLPSIIKIPIGFFEAFFLLLKYKPNLIISFGGFASFPVVFMGFFLRIPIIIHEQTAAAGRANLWAAPFVRKIALARASSKKFFKDKKTIVIGNPILSHFGKTRPKKKKEKSPMIFITGGSRGSRPINNLVEKSLPLLLAKYEVIHQTGEEEEKKFLEIKKKLARGEKYLPQGVIKPSSFVKTLEKADVVVSRAGANTVAEIVATGTPAILVPIAWAYKNEQQKNAEYAKGLIPVAILDEKDLTKDTLLQKIEALLDNWKGKTPPKDNPDLLAALKLVNLAEEYLK